MADTRLYTYYKNDVVKKLTEEFSYKNVMAIPKLEKITVNAGVGDAVSDRKLLDDVTNNIGLITGQKPVHTKAKKSISNFKLRDGMPIGCKVTLRGRMMYEFLDRFVNLTLPRTRDFQGVPDKSFDGRGNYNLGIQEHIIFPEIDPDKTNKIHGLQLTFVTTAVNDEEAYALLKHLGMPFKKRKNQ